MALARSRFSSDAGFSLMDVETLVRQKLPVVMVVGNNGIWGLEKHPMQAIYGWDVACDLQPLIDLYDASPEGEMNFPPDYPKMPGEPPRVQPSKKVAAHWDEDGNRIES